MDATLEADLNPSEISLGELIARTRSGSRSWVKYLKHYRAVLNAPHRVDGPDINEAIKAWTFVTLDDFPAQVTDASEVEMWENSFKAEYLQGLIDKQMPNFVIAAQSHLGTHTAKVPNPSAGGPGGLIFDDALFFEAAKLPFVSSASANVRQRLGAAGNAAQARAQRFLCGRFLIAGELVDVSRNIADKGIIYAAMIAIGFAKGDMDDLAVILSDRMNAPKLEEPGHFTKGVIWPTDEGDVVITPVHPYAMHVELAARIKERVAKGSRISNTHIVVGGLKPQNAGMVNSDMGGRHRLLFSIPPQTASSAARSIFRMAATGNIPFSGIGKSHPASVGFKATVSNVSWDNDAARDKLDRQIAALIHIAISQHVDASEAIRSGQGDPAKALAALDEPTRVLLTEGFDSIADGKDDLIKNLADHVASMVDIATDAALNRRIRDNAERILSETFKG